MKRALLTALLVFGVTTPALAVNKVLIGYWKPLAININEDNGLGVYPNQNRNLLLVESLIRATYYDQRDIKIEKASSDKIKTEEIRRGERWRNYGTAGEVHEQFGATVWIGGQTNTAGYARPDSALRISRGGPLVPFVWLPDNATVKLGSTLASFPALSDSFGVENEVSFYAYPQVNAVGSARGWTTMAYTEALRLSGTSGANNVRAMLIMRGSRESGYLKGEVYGPACIVCDSMRATGNQDSVVLLRRTYPTGMSTLVVASAWGSGAPADSVSGNTTAAEGDATIILAALAVADSACNGCILGPKPIQIAAVVKDVCSRGNRQGANGILAADTSAYYAALDTAAARGLKFTAIYDPDSAVTYGRDLIKLKENPLVRFAPSVTKGVRDTTTNAGNTSVTALPVDPFGRHRSRAAVGDTLGATNVVWPDGDKDTSLYSQLRRVKNMADSTFGSTRVSRVLFPALDDWSPKFLNGHRADPPLDSVLLAMKEAGFSGVCVNAQDPDASAMSRRGLSKTNPRGYVGRQGIHRSALIPGGFKLLAHTGYESIGGRSGYATMSDSVFAWDSLAVGIQYRMLERAWMGAIMPYDNSYDIYPYDNNSVVSVWPYWVNVQESLNDHLIGGRHGNIAMFSATDFSGAPDGPPPLNGLHALISINAAMDAINRFAGRTVCRLVYPEEIIP